MKQLPVVPGTLDIAGPHGLVVVLVPVALVEDEPQNDELQVCSQRRIAVDGAHDV